MTRESPDMNAQRPGPRPAHHPPSRRYGVAGRPVRRSFSGDGSLITDQDSSQREHVSALRRAVALRGGGFTLLELLIVMGITALLLVLIAPAFTYIKGGTDVTSAAYTVEGVLDTARTYAKANNTYTWVGFYEEDVSQPSITHGTDPCTGCVGRLVMSTVASKDGTVVYDPINPATIDIDATKLTQVGTLTKIDNVHLWTHTDTPSSTGSTFDTRPNVTSTYCIGDSSPTNSTTRFQYPVGAAPSAQYTFVKAVQFSPRGEARINNSTLNNGGEVFPLQPVAEIALEPTHGASVPASIPANSVAIQFTGIGGDVTIYRR